MLERRRRKAVALARGGRSASLIAKELNVDRKSIYRWLRMARRGDRALAAKPHPGRPRKLTAAQHAKLQKLLQKGPRANGWNSEHWTARSVASLVWKKFKVKHHVEHVRHILKHRLKSKARRNGAGIG